MSFDRLPGIQATLTDLYEQLAGQEQAWVLAEDAEKTRIQQKIRLKWQEIRKYESDYALTLSQHLRGQTLPEPLAEIVTAEIIETVELLEPGAKDDQVKGLLQQILAELQKPGIPASAKLKVAIPIIPNVVSYEIEGDTESVVRRLFPTFTRVYEGLRAQLPDGKK